MSLRDCAGRCRLAISKASRAGDSFANSAKIVVCESRRAVMTANMLSDKKIDILSQAEYIGPYRKMGNSPYYFRWLDED